MKYLQKLKPNNSGARCKSAFCGAFNRAFTVAEAAVSMALVVMAALLVVSICVFSTSHTQQSYVSFQASNMPQDILACYISAREDAPDNYAAQHLSMRQRLYFYIGYTDMKMDISDGDDYSVNYQFSLNGLNADVEVAYARSCIFIDIYGSDSSLLQHFGYDVINREEVER